MKDLLGFIIWGVAIILYGIVMILLCKHESPVRKYEDKYEAEHEEK
jgi:hypothetical protein